MVCQLMLLNTYFNFDFEETNLSESLLSLKIGRRSVEENLNQAIAEGRLLKQGDGTLLLAGNTLGADMGPWLSNNQEPPPDQDCRFLVTIQRV